MAGYDAAALIAEKRQGKKAEPESEGSAMDAAKRAAYQKLRKALQGDDDAKGIAALDQYLEACGYGD